MPEQKSNEISRDRLAELLNEDLAREYQAIIAYVVYSQVLKGAEYMAVGPDEMVDLDFLQDRTDERSAPRSGRSDFLNGSEGAKNTNEQSNRST